MRPWIGPAMAGLAALGSCAPTPPPAPAAAAATSAAPDAAQPTANKVASCGVELLNHRVRPGEDMQAIFRVRPDTQWCFGVITIGNTQTEGQAIAALPSHGDLRLVHQSGAIVFGYRPAPGFTGTDHFRISMPAQIETMYLAATVTIAP